MSSPRKFIAIILPFVLGIVLGIGIGSMEKDSRESRSAGHYPQPAEPNLISAVPDLRQNTEYSCGASALQAVFAYWDIDVQESTLIEELESEPLNGTKPQDIIRVAQDYGLRAEMKEGLSIPDLRRALERGIPVIVDIQAWPGNEATPSDWEHNWEDGHYVVVIGADDHNVYIEDPSLIGARGMIPHADFLDRWHDYEGDPPYQPGKGRAYIRLGFLIEGTTKSSSIPIVPVQ